MAQKVYDCQHFSAQELGETIIHFAITPLNKFNDAEIINTDAFFDIAASKTEEEIYTLAFYNMLADVILTLKKDCIAEIYHANLMLSYFIMFSIAAHTAEEHNLITNHATLHKEIELENSYLYNHELLNFTEERNLKTQKEASVYNLVHYLKSIEKIANYNIFIETVSEYLSLEELLTLKKEQDLNFILAKASAYNNTRKSLQKLIKQFPSNNEEEEKTIRLKLDAIKNVLPILYDERDIEDLNTPAVASRIKRALKSKAPAAEIKQLLISAVMDEN